MSDRVRLDSWKAIAGYLGRDVRTVIRWEQQRGLPVSRVPGGGLSRVFAYTDELDQWLASGPGSSAPESDEAPASGEGSVEKAVPEPDLIAAPPRRRASWVIAGVAAAALAIWAISAADLGYSRAEPPKRVAVAGNQLEAFDQFERRLWTHEFERGSVVRSNSYWSHIGDLDGDSREDILAAIELIGPPTNPHTAELIRFSAGGQRVWSVPLQDRLRFREGEYAPPWSQAHLTAFPVRGAMRIAWTVHHFTWWPAMLLTFDANGERLGTFVNSGWILLVEPSPDGRHLLLTGVSNAAGAYFIGVLDAERPVGRSPEPTGGPTECLSCPDGHPLRYYVLPRSDVSRQQPFPSGGPTIQTFEGRGVQIHSVESGGPNVAAIIYEFEPDLTIREARFSDSFWEWHRRLELEGRLRHSASDCPERRGLDVRMWTSADGWQTVRVPVK